MAVIAIASVGLSASTTATPTEPIVVDDGEEMFAFGGEWSKAINKGHDDDFLYAKKADLTDKSTYAKAQWKFNVRPGRYRISAMWTHFKGAATNAPYTIYDGEKPIATIRVNQTRPPYDPQSNSIPGILGEFDIKSDTIIVEITNAADNIVEADAVGVEWVSH